MQLPSMLFVIHVTRQTAYVSKVMSEVKTGKSTLFSSCINAHQHHYTELKLIYKHTENICLRYACYRILLFEDLLPKNSPPPTIHNTILWNLFYPSRIKTVYLY